MCQIISVWLKVHIKFQVDLQYVNYNPHQRHKDLMSSNVQLKIKLSELHSSENGQLEIRCEGTIPDYHQHKHYADVRSKTVTGKFSPPFLNFINFNRFCIHC